MHGGVTALRPLCLPTAAAGLARRSPHPAEAAGREETRAARSAARVADGLAAGNSPPRVPRRRARWFRLVLSALESGCSGASFP